MFTITGIRRPKWRQPEDEIKDQTEKRAERLERFSISDGRLMLAG
jgi:hypothetical protein